MSASHLLCSAQLPSLSGPLGTGRGSWASKSRSGTCTGTRARPPGSGSSSGAGDRSSSSRPSGFLPIPPLSHPYNEVEDGLCLKGQEAYSILLPPLAPGKDYKFQVFAVDEHICRSRNVYLEHHIPSNLTHPAAVCVCQILLLQVSRGGIQYGTWLRRPWMSPLPIRPRLLLPQTPGRRLPLPSKLLLPKVPLRSTERSHSTSGYVQVATHGQQWGSCPCWCYCALRGAGWRCSPLPGPPAAAAGARSRHRRPAATQSSSRDGAPRSAPCPSAPSFEECLASL